MKVIPEGYKDIDRLTKLYCYDLITADEYFAAVEEYSKVVIREELKQKSAQKETGWVSWIDTESIRGPKKKRWWSRDRSSV